MWFAVILASIAFLFSFANNKNQRANKAGIFLFILMMLMCGLRHKSVGADTMNYYNIYLYDTGYRIEFMFQFIRDICKQLGFPPSMFIFINAILTYIPIINVLKLKSPNISLSACIYIIFSAFLFANSFNVIRMAVAGSFFLWAIVLYIDNKKIKAVLAVSIAIGFHYTIILPILLAVILIAIKEISINTNILRVIIIVSAAFGLFSESIMDQINNLLMVANMDDLTLGDFSVSMYANKIDESENNLVGLLSMIIPYSLVCVLFVDRFKYDVFYRLLFLGCIINNIFIQVTLIYRLTAYFYLFIILVLPIGVRELYQKRNKKTLYALYGVVSFMFVWYLYKLIIQEASPAGMFPYKTFFE